MTGRAKGLVTAAVLALLVAVGCGGGGGDRPAAPAADSREAEKRWLARVDAECEKANDAIARRGWPADLVDLDRLVVRAIEDVRSAGEAIGGLKIPPGAGPEPGRFVNELEALDAELEQLSAASEDLEPQMLIDAAEALKVRLARIGERADALGLRECLQNDERQFVPDAIHGPVFAQQLADLDRRLLRRIKRIDFAEARTPEQLATMFHRYAQVVDDAVAGIQKLDPPLWAAPQTARYQKSLLDLQGASQQVETVLETENRAAFARADRRLQKAAQAEIKARRRMIRAIGAAPTTPPTVPEEGAPETEEVA